jgi:hypothetical protein
MARPRRWNCGNSRPSAVVAVARDLRRIVVEHVRPSPGEALLPRREEAIETLARIRDVGTVALRGDEGGELERTRSSSSAASLRTSSAATGIEEPAFQNASNASDTASTAGPNVSTSRSVNATSPAPKYSSPMLRPPRIAAWLSATNALLCMRRFTRDMSPSMPSARKLRLATGLKRRISMLGWASSATRTSSLAFAPTSSMRTRTRTPRSAARSSA